MLLVGMGWCVACTIRRRHRVSSHVIFAGRVLGNLSPIGQRKCLQSPWPKMAGPAIGVKERPARQSHGHIRRKSTRQSVAQARCSKNRTACTALAFRPADLSSYLSLFVTECHAMLHAHSVSTRMYRSAARPKRQQQRPKSRVPKAVGRGS